MYRDYPLQYGVIESMAKELACRMYVKVCDLRVRGYVTKEPVPYEEREKGEYKEFSIGEKWGGLFDCGWFCLSASLPPDVVVDTLYMKLDFSGEALLFDESGVPLKGFTSVKSRGSEGFGKTVYPAAGFIKDGAFLAWIDAGNNDLFGEYLGGTLAEASLVACNEEIRSLYYDCEVLCGLLKTLPESEAWHAIIKEGLSDAECILQNYTKEEIARCKEITARLLSVKGAETGFEISALGHSHLDLAWTWPLRETKRKAARTLATALAAMDRWTDYVYTASQAQMFEWIETMYPALFDRLKKRIATGNFEPQGGMWVECDLNVPCGESLVRQFLYGQHYFKEKFGKKADVCWLPDSFGFTGSLPQLIRSAGMDYFLTMKIRTAPHNIVYPHDTFFWEGIDGSRVLTHSTPFAGYNSTATPREIKEGEARFRDKGRSSSALLLYGQGDGGGGAGYECFERLSRERDLAGIPAVKKRSAREFFEIAATSAHKYPTWFGSMELDMHTGTLTSAARSKAYNKKAEVALHTVEWLCAAAGTARFDGEIERIWKEVLLYQFHDILTGTSIERVYEESLARYALLLGRLEEMINELTRLLCEEKEGCVTFVNPAPVSRTHYCERGGKPYKTELAPYSLTALSEEVEPTVSCGTDSIENEYLKATFAKDGTLCSLYDKQNDKEAVAERANKLALYEDDLKYGDDLWSRGSAWDIPIRYPDKAAGFAELISSKTYADGCAARCEQVYRIGNSELTQNVILHAGSRRLDFETRVIWKEKRKMLRAHFGCNVFASQAVRGLQFGSAVKPVHKNTVWEDSCFETPFQKYIDLSDGGYGCALIAPDKYGCSVKNGALSLCLLRSSDYPAEGLDEGVQEFTYSFMPHIGDYREGGVLQEAYRAEYPVRVCENLQAKPAKLQIAAKESAVVIETMKRGLNGGVAVRVYEPFGRACRTELQTGKFASAKETDLLEERAVPVENAGGAVKIDLRPYEIKTFILNGEDE